jgi:hypothetical protein
MDFQNSWSLEPSRIADAHLGDMAKMICGEDDEEEKHERIGRDGCASLKSAIASCAWSRLALGSQESS